MAGESQATPEAVPDPSVLTTDALTRAAKAERDYVNGRLDAIMAHIDRMDKATEVLSETVNRTPTEIQREIKHLRELGDEQINGISAVVQQRREAVDRHFEHLDSVRAEDKREARSLVDLALAAQKEASAVALLNANKAIDKAQESTEKRYDTLDKSVQELRIMLASMMPRKESEARHSAHEQAVNALISRTTAIEATKVGVQETKTLDRGSNAATVAVISVCVAMVVMLLLVASFFIAKPS
jgi:hypothetical protein